MVCYNMIWYGMVLYGMVRYDMIWYDTIWYSCTRRTQWWMILNKLSCAEMRRLFDQCINNLITSHIAFLTCVCCLPSLQQSSFYFLQFICRKKLTRQLNRLLLKKTGLWHSTDVKRSKRARRRDLNFRHSLSIYRHRVVNDWDNSEHITQLIVRLQTPSSKRLRQFWTHQTVDKVFCNVNAHYL